MPWPRELPQGDIDMTNEAFACMKIDAPLSAQVWDTQDTDAVRFEVMLTCAGARGQRPRRQTRPLDYRL